MSLFNAQQLQQFIEKGFIHLPQAFSTETAAAARTILWKATGLDPNDRSTWTQPVVRIGELSLPPFVAAANTPPLHQAFDELAGKGLWIPRNSLGSFPIRFPSTEAPGDDGWHVDVSFPGEDAANYFTWRSNVFSRGRALLMLFLFSEVGDNDAPTRIRVGSHLAVAQLLAPYGETGLSFMELAQRLTGTSELPVVHATGMAGDVYLCHPFLVHAAQAHQGMQPKFMAQPPLAIHGQYDPFRASGSFTPVEAAIRKGVGLPVNFS
ncbi:phytanoyl-CoA dioxygenase family protein [Paraflavitalea pollutisoli]|uniref:phytanoyl-CoA dioxygenase family protein n=1 Tax=Paraflavitalea pollutisoli TaxID=3034143 RepID=UPI0023ED3313|nr:phytanoyl-CoA dioxygenase family protein [Paraflavitalea sp. H1-2-19X]